MTAMTPVPATKTKTKSESRSRSATRLRRIGCALAGLAALLLLTGCNLAAKVVVQPDGSGSYSVIMSLPKSAGSDPGQTLYRAAQRGATQSDIPLTVAPYSAPGASGVMLTFHFKSLNDLNAESHRLAASGKGAIGVTVERDASGWHFSASTAGSMIMPSDESGANGSGGVTGGPINSSQLGSLISVDLVVTLPGAPAENNAKTVAHTDTASTFTWVLSSVQPSVVRASTTYVGNQANVKLATALTPAVGRSSSGGAGVSGTTVALLAVGSVLVVAAAGTALVLARRRKGSPPSEPEPAPGPATAD